MHEVYEKIFTVNLGVKKGEKVLVFTDTVNPEEEVDPEEVERRLELPDIAGEIAEVGRRFAETRLVDFPSVMGHGKEPPEVLWAAAFGSEAVERLKDEDLLIHILHKDIDDEGLYRAGQIIREYAVSPDAVIALSNYSTTHTRFRSLLTECKGTRYASMPLFERAMLDGAMAVDWNELEKRTLGLRTRLKDVDMVAVTNHDGTSITFSIEERPVLADTGILTEPGAYGNLPAGEVFAAPVEGSADGTLILEWAPTRRLLNPVTLEVKGGLVTEVHGHEKYADILRAAIKGNRLCGNIAELGIGTNERATRPDNILETEKILGTVHIALGDNASFGGKTSVPFHQDFIFYKPTVEVFRGDEREEILVNGEPRF